MSSVHQKALYSIPSFSHAIPEELTQIMPFSVWCQNNSKTSSTAQRMLSRLMHSIKDQQTVQLFLIWPQLKTEFMIHVMTRPSAHWTFRIYTQINLQVFMTLLEFVDLNHTTLFNILVSFHQIKRLQEEWLDYSLDVSLFLFTCL